MLKADKLLIAKLSSDCESQYEQAAHDLAALPRGHFEQHPLSRKYVVEHQNALINNFHQTRNQVVRDWIVQVLADVQARGNDFNQIVKQSLHPDCSFLTTLLYAMLNDPYAFRDCKETIKLLSTHANAEVRWRCASFLEKIPLDYDIDIDSLRRLMVDEDETVRLYAVLALKNLRRLEAADRAILNQVLQVPDSARAYAMEILASDWAK
ncbi:hypothetical protein [Undibacterium baiyunense]|uniref:HEAT repeat-containing protein n=1 Tax=Undibacterium baiyunense TaxID=2828731 RepID=A0A941DC12_9BURK|nr:hypothetical protein [Undibacterium baiyunense]MBR7745914.1 hypothetical protein [Undibacterium baiyunense]